MSQLRQHLTPAGGSCMEHDDSPWDVEFLYCVYIYVYNVYNCWFIATITRFLLVAYVVITRIRWGYEATYSVWGRHIV